MTATIEQINKAIAELDAAVKKSYELLKGSFYLESTVSNYKSFATYTKVTEYDLLLLEIKKHKELINNLTALETAITNPDNDPANYKVVMESENADVKALTKEFLPTMQNIKKEVGRLLEDLGASPESERIHTLTFLADTTGHLIDAVNDKFHDTAKLKPLLNDINIAKVGPVSKFLKKHNEFAAFLGFMAIAVCVGLAVGGAASCAVPGGVVAGVAMIAAAVLMFSLGVTLMKMGGFDLRDDRKGGRQYHVAEMTDNLDKFAKNKKTIDGFKRSEQVLNETSLIELTPLARQSK